MIEDFEEKVPYTKRPLSIKTQVAVDVHAPGPERANVQSQSQDEFYTTFDVKPGDGMYLAPEERVHIW